MINVENAVQNADDTEDAHDAHDADDVDVKQVNKPSPSPSPSPSTKTHKFFKSAIHSDMLYDFIKKISYKMPNSEYYLIDLNAYKKAVYCSEPQSVSLLEQFCSDLLPYYCKEKQVFLTRKMSYNNLNTILRQVCRHCAIECKSERKYDKSKTHIVYYIASETQTHADK
jgi:hypothetical protein